MFCLREMARALIRADKLSCHSFEGLVRGRAQSASEITELTSERSSLTELSLSSAYSSPRLVLAAAVCLTSGACYYWPSLRLGYVL